MSETTAPEKEMASAAGGSLGFFSRAIRRAARALMELPANARADAEARALAQSLWGICVVCHPQAFGKGEAHNSNRRENAAMLGSSSALALEEIKRASPRALEIAFRRPGVWSTSGCSKGSEGAPELLTFDEYLTTPLILAAVSGNAALMSLFLDHSDTAAVERAIPLERLAHFKLAPMDDSSRAMTPLLAAAIHSHGDGVAIFEMIASKVTNITPDYARCCLLSAPKGSVQALSAYFEKRNIELAMTPATGRGRDAKKGSRL